MNSEENFRWNIIVNSINYMSSTNIKKIYKILSGKDISTFNTRELADAVEFIKNKLRKLPNETKSQLANNEKFIRQMKALEDRGVSTYAFIGGGFAVGAGAGAFIGPMGAIISGLLYSAFLGVVSYISGKVVDKNIINTLKDATIDVEKKLNK